MLFPTLFRDYSQITQSEDRDPFLKKNYEVFWGSYLEDNCFCGKSNKMRRRRLSLCQPQQCINSLKESTLFLCTELGWKFSQLCGELCREIDPANKIKYFFFKPSSVYQSRSVPTSATRGCKHKNSNCLLLHCEWEVTGQLQQRHTNLLWQWFCKEK